MTYIKHPSHKDKKTLYLQKVSQSSLSAVESAEFADYRHIL
jgi:hypothetical protein